MLVLMKDDALDLLGLAETKGYVLTDEERRAIEKCGIFMEACNGDTSINDRYSALELEPLGKIEYKKKALDHYTDSINEFPPHVQTIAGIFFRTFTIPTGTIPKRRERSKFSEWIRQFEYLAKVGGTYSGDAMARTFKRYQRTTFPVARPAAVNSYFSDSVSEILREIESTKVPIIKVEEKVTTDDVVDIGSLFDDDLEV